MKRTYCTIAFKRNRFVMLQLCCTDYFEGALMTASLSKILLLRGLNSNTFLCAHKWTILFFLCISFFLHFENALSAMIDWFSSISWKNCMSLGNLFLGFGFHNKRILSTQRYVFPKFEPLTSHCHQTCCWKHLQRLPDFCMGLYMKSFSSFVCGWKPGKLQGQQQHWSFRVLSMLR